MRVGVWLLHLLRTKSTQSLEASLALEALVTGLYLLLPGQASFSQSRLFPDLLVGGIMVLHGVGSLLALYFQDVSMCRRAALAGTGIWAIISAEFIWVPSGGYWFVPIFVVLCLSSLWVYLRLLVRFKDPVP